MAQQFATGAVHVFVQGPSNNLPQYLGTCESMPQDTRSPSYEPLMNDYSGSQVPLDFAWEGESAQISCVMTRWSEIVVQLLETKPRVGVGGNPNGAWFYSDVGALMGFEGLTWQLWLAYTFGAALANKPAYVANKLPMGRYYPQCIVWAPMTEDIGARPMKRHIMFLAWPKLLQTSPKQFQLYSTGLGDTTFSAINIGLIS